MREKKRTVLFLVAIVSLGTTFRSCQYCFASEPSSFIADFDSLPEGYRASSFTDGGITFFDLDWYADLGDEGAFMVESVGQEYDLGPFFTRPNFLSPCGYSPGPGYIFSRFGAAKITCGMDGINAQLDIFSNFPSPNTLELQALLNGAVVATDFMNFNQGPLHTRLAISGEGVRFDLLQLVASGPFENGAVFIGIDNVSITPVPEPASVILIGAGFFFARLRRRQS